MKPAQETLGIDVLFSCVLTIFRQIISFFAFPEKVGYFTGIGEITISALPSIPVRITVNI
jgi:hypothetical protein